MATCEALGRATGAAGVGGPELRSSRLRRARLIFGGEARAGRETFLHPFRRT